MNVLFYVAAVVAVGSGIAVIVQVNVVHALLYMIVSLIAVAAAMFALGAPFAAAGGCGRERGSQPLAPCSTRLA